jgi:hypothetical protein
VADSETVELARRLYLEHREAFEIVYTHRYTHQKRLREVLIELVRQTPGLVYRGKAGIPPEEWILFYPEEWDVPILHRAREDDGGRGALILSFVFDNYVDSLSLKLEFGPGDDDVRHSLLEMAHGDPKLFAVAPPTPDPAWVTTIWKTPILNQGEYMEGTYSDLEDLLRKRWDNFLKDPFRQLTEAVRLQEWMRTDAV